MKAARSAALSAALLAGALPVAAVHLAYALNVAAGLEACFPYLDGCMSVSRAARSGPGLAWFKALAAPAALAMAWTWWTAPAWLAAYPGGEADRSRLIAGLGLVGAAFFAVYAGALGGDGDLYRWMRRYGVVLYFGLTGLAHLLLAARLWRGPVAKSSPGGARRAVRVYLGVILVGWALGVAAALKRSLIDDPALQSRVENALEWGFALCLSLAFLAIGGLIYHGLRPRASRPG